MLITAPTTHEITNEKGIAEKHTGKLIKKNLNIGGAY